MWNTTRSSQASKFCSHFGSYGFGARKPLRRRDLTVSSSLSAAAPSAPGAPGGGGMSTMDGGGGVPVGATPPEPPAREPLVVLVVPVGDVVSDVDAFQAI